MEKMILGKNTVFNYDRENNNNIAVFASTRAGKTKSIVEPTLLYTNESSLVVSLAKRDLFYRYAPVFAKRGYKVYDLDFTSSFSPYGYDPLQYIKNDKDILSLAKTIISFGSPDSLAKGDDLYWYQGAISFLAAEIGLILQYECNPLHIQMDFDKKEIKAPTFLDILDIHRNLNITFIRDSITTPLQYLFDAEERRSPGNFACRHWNTVKNLPSKTFSCIFSIVNASLENLFIPSVEKIIANKNQIDLSKIGEEKSIVFITTSPVESATGLFTNIFYGDLFKILYNEAQIKYDGILPIPVKVICDDFAVTEKIPNFEKYISVFCASGISAILLLQSESQLISLYGIENATTIINNCDTYVYMGGNDLRTAETISKRMNVPLEDILYAPIGKVFICKRGSKPIITERYPIYEDELYLEIEGETEIEFKRT